MGKMLLRIFYVLPSVILVIFLVTLSVQGFMVSQNEPVETRAVLSTSSDDSSSSNNHSTPTNTTSSSEDYNIYSSPTPANDASDD